MAATSARQPHPFAAPSTRDARSRTQTQMSSSSSQMLPSITCSSCGVSIQMDDLGSHICQPGAGGSNIISNGSSSLGYQHQQPLPDTYRSKDERGHSQPQARREQARPQRHDQYQRESSASQNGGEKRGGGLKLDMSQLRPPDTSGFLAAGDAGMAGVGRRAFGGKSSCERVGGRYQIELVSDTTRFARHHRDLSHRQVIHPPRPSITLPLEHHPRPHPRRPWPPLRRQLVWGNKTRVNLTLSRAMSISIDR